jgi:hypothetical protein
MEMVAQVTWPETVRMAQEAVQQFLNRITQLSAVQSRAAHGYALEYLEMNEDEVQHVHEGLDSFDWVPLPRAGVPRTERPDGPSGKGSVNRAAALRKILDRVTFSG